MKLTFTDKQVIATSFEIELPALLAVIAVESSGDGFDPVTKKIKIQFEPYHFKKRTGVLIKNGVEGQAAEWTAFKAALVINPKAAYESTSWGLGQIMGFNHKLAGYASAKEMVDDFSTGEYKQLLGMINFIKNQPLMYKALKEKDWLTFARLYNGPKQKGYDTKLKFAYDKYK